MTGKVILEFPSVENFLRYFGIGINPLENPDQFITALSQLDPRYQGGRDLVRWQLEIDQTQWEDEAKNVIMACAEDMRMLEPETPLVGDFDVVIALGGARQSNLDRARYAAQAMSDCSSNFDYLVVAGSNRPLKDTEIESVKNYAPGAETEFDLCAAAAKTVAVEYPYMVTSQMLIDNEKAGTPEVIECVLHSVSGDSVAVVTTQIYQLSTKLDLRRVARSFGIKKMMVAGTPSASSAISARTTATYLSEVLRTLRAAVLAAQAGV